jgi:hypothetical protein
MLIHSASRFDGSAIVPKYNSEPLAITDNIRDVRAVRSCWTNGPGPLIASSIIWTEFKTQQKEKEDRRRK